MTLTHTTDTTFAFTIRMSDPVATRRMRSRRSAAGDPAGGM
jgi:hypothetical protein